MRQNSGYVALLAVLILGAAALAVGTGLLIAGTDSQRATLAAQQSQQARNLALACAEEALQQLHDNTSFTSTNTQLSIGQGTCTHTVTNTGGSNRTVDSTGTVNNIVRKVKIYATIGASSISITSWQEVP